MDKEINYQLWQAFHLGARSTLALEGKQITSPQVQELKRLLREIADGSFTLHDPGTEAMNEPLIRDLIAHVAPAGMNSDKELAGRILQFWT
jgi:hypothetical protein